MRPSRCTSVTPAAAAARDSSSRKPPLANAPARSMSGAMADCADGCLELRRGVPKVGDGAGKTGHHALLRRLAQPPGGAQHLRGLALQAGELVVPGGERVLQCGGWAAGRFGIVHCGIMEGGGGCAKGAAWWAVRVLPPRRRVVAGDLLPGLANAGRRGTAASASNCRKTRMPSGARPRRTSNA